MVYLVTWLIGEQDVLPVSATLFSAKKTVKENYEGIVFQRVVIPTTIQTAYFMCLGISILYKIILLMSASHVQVIIIFISTIRE